MPPLCVIDRELRATRASASSDGIFHLAVRLSLKVSGWVVASIGTIDFTLIDELGDGWFRGTITVPEAVGEGNEPSALFPVRLFVGDQSFDLARICF